MEKMRKAAQGQLCVGFLRVAGEKRKGTRVYGAICGIQNREPQEGAMNGATPTWMSRWVC